MTSTSPRSPEQDLAIPVRLASDARAIAAFRFLRGRLTRNAFRSVVAGSRLRAAMILICSVIFWAGSFGLFFGGFEFLATYVSLVNEFVEYIFSLFFLSMLVMLFFSTGIIMYTSLFQSREAAFLMSGPASADRIFAYKFFETLAFSSWAFLLLGSPMLVAYGITVGVSWKFYSLFLVYLFAFVLIPGSLGAIAALLVAVFLPRRRKTIITLGVIAILGLAAGVIFQVWKTPGDTLTPEWLDALLGRLSFCRHPLLPSRWMAKGLVETARDNVEDGLFYLKVTAAHGFLAYLVAAVLARDLYRLGYGRVLGERSARKRYGWYALDDIFHKLFFYIPRPIRLLILKDLRTFRRDPAQWSQFLIFFGLLAFYFTSIRRLGYDTQQAYWRNLISFLNLAVTALLLSTFTSRFIFPLLSLEGRNFWVLGLLPLKRASILWGKFAFAVGISLVVTELLILLSDSMLRMGAGMTLLHMGMVAILCLGLSAISVGLGARLPNLKEDDPSKIATGFGGTLNLLVSLVFIFAIVATLALPCHLYFAGQDGGDLGGYALSESRFQFWLGAAVAASLLIGVAGTVIPLRIGIKAFQRMEF